ncbi:hypothetical protein TWF225_002168 [Orbilia oligospora]|nr:hypothetical protein TWF751_009085 [Orbilia oligospora]KAF3190407.1 hypothetical protein TWF225_002168 [Orbilia oligospora]KAF3242629.1 hypothetical protein TWF217_011489 [Orbilia oligospora]KAF3257980.1 hypothetical protein TWF128_004880 [Orbilia oligospora]KAF3286368.1 hypothetical protein TWF132_008939 [Orbilia oligospora]
MQTSEEGKDLNLSSGFNSAGVLESIGNGNESHELNKTPWPIKFSTEQDWSPATTSNEAFQTSTFRFNGQFHFEYDTPSYSPDSLDSFHPDQRQTDQHLLQNINTTTGSFEYPHSIPTWQLMSLSNSGTDVILNCCETFDQGVEDASLNTPSHESSSPGTGLTSQRSKLFLEDHRGIYLDSTGLLTPPTSGKLPGLSDSMMRSRFQQRRAKVLYRRVRKRDREKTPIRLGKSGNDCVFTPPGSHNGDRFELSQELIRQLPSPRPTKRNVMSDPLESNHPACQTYEQCEYIKSEDIQKKSEKAREEDSHLGPSSVTTQKTSSSNGSSLNHLVNTNSEGSSSALNVSYDYTTAYSVYDSPAKWDLASLAPNPRFANTRHLLHKKLQYDDETAGGTAELPPNLIYGREYPPSTTNTEGELSPYMGLVDTVPVVKETNPLHPEELFGAGPSRIRYGPYPYPFIIDEGYQSLQPSEVLSCTYEDSRIGDINTPRPRPPPDPETNLSEPPEVSDPIYEIKLPPSTEENDSGYQEEKAVKVAALYILIQYFLLREYHLKSQSASTTPFSRPPSSAENYSDSQSEQCDDLEDQGDSGRKCDSYTESSAETAGIESRQTQESRVNPHKRKRDDQEEGGREDEDDQGPNKKRSKNVDLNSLGSRLACPFAKGRPSSHLACALIGRQDLAGVKEHLKRNHFEKKLPPEIRACRRWDQVFRVCITDWDDRNPIPSPYLSIGFEILRPVIGLPLPVTENLTVSCETPRQTGINSMTHVNTTSPTAGQAFSGTTIAPHVPSTVNQPPAGEGLEGIVQAENPYFPQPLSGEPQNSIAVGDTSVQNNPELPYQPNLAGQFEFPQEFNEWVKPRADPHIPWPPGPEFAEAFDGVPQYLLGNYGIDMNLAPADLYPVLKTELNIPPTLSSYYGTAPSNAPPGAVFPPTPNPGINSSASFVSPNSSAYTPSITQSMPSVSTVTAISTPSAPRNEPISNRYTLLVARKHPVSDSAEPHGPKQFDFDSYETFLQFFEPWILATFIDPLFSWETMEFLGANPEITSRLSDINQVLMDIRMHHSRYRTTEATLLLVSKDKGKQKA